VIAKHQIELKQQTEQMLQTKVGELQGVNDSLARTQQELANTEHLMQELQAQIVEANKINDQISQTLLAAQQHIPDIARVSDGSHDHEGAVVVNIGELSDANLSFNQHNTNLTQLTDELKKQLVFMTKFQDTLSQHAAIFSAGAMDLNETDDKLLAAAQSLGGTAVQREKLLRQMSEKFKKTQDVLKTLKQALEQIADPKLKEEFNPIIHAIDELD
jgi:ribonuclease P protein component